MTFLHNLIPVQSLANAARLDILTFMFAVAVLTIAVVLLSAGLGSIIGTIIHRINNPHQTVGKR